MADMRRYRTEILLCFGLALLTLLAFKPLCTDPYEFLNLDDQKYVSNNPQVQTGLSRANVEWAFTTFHASLWHPLTWLSLQLDAQLHGLDARGFHFTNVLLHQANVVLLFLVFWRLTDAPWRSAAVAAFFAIHPLHVESVAWITERKDVLSTFFWLLTLGVYTSYAQRVGPACRAGREGQALPGVSNPAPGDSPSPRSCSASGTYWLYLLLLFLFALGLLAKAMLVTLPCVLLLLDYWPLRRWTSLRATGRLVAEKVPLFLLALGCCVLAVLAGKTQVQASELLPLHLRAANAVVNYVTYLRQMVWPSDLAAFYPHPAAAYYQNTPWFLSERAVLVAGGLLLAVTGLVFWQGRRYPYLVVGWLWYVGTLMPVIGLVQNGIYGHADRYTYVPLIGIFLLLAWGLPDLLKRWSVPSVVPGSAAAVLLAVCFYLTCSQIRYWQNSVVLWEHTLKVTTPNPVAEQSLGFTLALQGKNAEAARHFEKAVQLDPHYARAYCHLGDLQLSEGRLKDAEANYVAARNADPDWAAPRASLGNVLLRKGDLIQAAVQFEDALQREPGSPIILVGLGECRLRQGRPDEAVYHLRAALESDPSLWQAHFYLGSALRRQEKAEQAVPHLEDVVRQQPEFGPGQNELAQALWQLGQHEQGLACFRAAIRIQPDNPRFHADMAAALWELGQTAQADVYYRRADRIDPEWQRKAQRMAWTYATHPDASHRRKQEGVHLARVVCHASHDEGVEELDTLAAAYAETGRFDAAVQTAQKALARAEAGSQTSRVEAIRGRLRLYEGRKPFREGKGP